MASREKTQAPAVDGQEAKRPAGMGRITPEHCSGDARRAESSEVPFVRVGHP